MINCCRYNLTYSLTVKVTVDGLFPEDFSKRDIVKLAMQFEKEHVSIKTFTEPPVL